MSETVLPRHVPAEALVVDCLQESRLIFTLRLRFTDPAIQALYRFRPGQFNMLSLPGVGEVPISIVSDPLDEHLFDHTIRAVGRTTRALVALARGARLGVRGPFGRGWPLSEVQGRDIVIVSGGLGCAPTVSVINYVLRRRGLYRRLVIVQGVKHAEDLIWGGRYDAWRRQPDTQVLLAADVGAPLWPWRVGFATDLLDLAEFDPASAGVMLCGPEGMMRVATRRLLARGVSANDIWLSLERNMRCGIGLCGHCQFGAAFVCRDGPVFNYGGIRPLLGVKGY